MQTAAKEKLRQSGVKSYWTIPQEAILNFEFSSRESSRSLDLGYGGSPFVFDQYYLKGVYIVEFFLFVFLKKEDGWRCFAEHYLVTR